MGGRITGADGALGLAELANATTRRRFLRGAAGLYGLTTTSSGSPT